MFAGKHRRLQFIECENDLNAMIDAAKFADLVLLLIDGGYGFEMETFEFLNILQVRDDRGVCFFSPSRCHSIDLSIHLPWKVYLFSLLSP